ncbi:hypothetical protein LCGC14_1586490 [marine sediment metagenome]|uniref:Uncharacterized protein n=1 Tax=marine sediment metagenome TaxID=412755 RepID=A0A0F9KVV7_9ZZZZ
MRVKEEYSSTSENDTKKLVISNGAYAVCEMIEKLIDKLEHARLTG